MENQTLMLIKKEKKKRKKKEMMHRCHVRLKGIRGCHVGLMSSSLRGGCHVSFEVGF